MRRRIWTFGLLFGMALGLLLALSYGVNADFDHRPTLLSEENAVCDAVEPRAASSADGEWLAVVWVQGGQDAVGICKTSGKAVLRAATEGETQSGWSDRLTVFEGSPTGACVLHTDVAVSGTIAHVVATLRDPCIITDTGTVQTTWIRYRTCDLSASPVTCSGPATAVQVQAGTAEGKRITDVRITLDAQGHPHLVFGLADLYNANGEIWYHRDLGGGWGAEGARKLSWTIGGKNVAYRPRIAWGTSGGQGQVHFVWEVHQDEVASSPKFFDGEIYYANCQDSGVSCTSPMWLGSARGVIAPFDKESTHPFPAVAARDNHVFVIWNNCQDIDAENNPCEKFGLQYRRSDDNGSTFKSTREAVTDLDISIVGMTRVYTGTDFYGQSGEEMPEYEKFIRPAVALNAQGYPYIAWQVKNTGIVGIAPYYLMTAYVTGTVGTDGYGWVQDWKVDYDEFGYLMPAVILPDLAPGHYGTHIIYMQDDRSHPYRVYYDYLGEGRDPDPEPTATPYCGGEYMDCYVYMPHVARNK